MRIAIAGLGSAALRGHLPAIARLGPGKALLVAAADPDGGRRLQLTARLPGVAQFESAERMLASVACDLLVVAADPGAHAELVTCALRRGTHVLCEKPLAVTRAQYDHIAAAHAAHPGLGIVSVHQYRYSRGWRLIAQCARLASRLRVPFSLAVEVQRTSADPLAASPWRADVDRFGGMLADHGVHYLALAWTVDPHLDVLAGVRVWNAAGERSGASVRLGSGLLTIAVRNDAPVRRTSVVLHVGKARLAWCDDRMEVVAGPRRLLAMTVGALTDRVHVDALYERLYRDVAARLERPAWRAHRTAEALAVGRSLLTLLDTAPAEDPAPTRPPVSGEGVPS